MRNDDGMTPLERELEAALGGLAPARANIDRDCVMFRAGRASVRRKNRLWQGLSSILVILLLVSIVSRPQSTPRERRADTVVYNTPSLSPSVAATVDENRAEAFRQYVRTRRAVLDQGVEALPTLSGYRGSSIDPPLTREDLKDLLSST